MAKMKAQRKDRRKSFREELAELTAADPEFHDYLRSEEADLLEMEEEDDASNDVEEESSSDSNADDTEDADKLTLVGLMVNGDRIVVSRDRATGKGLVNADIVGFLRTILRAPNRHRGQLKAAIDTGVKCFHACLEWLHRTESTTKSLKRHSQDNSQFVVKSERVFHAIVKLCTKHMPKCLLILLRPMGGARNGLKLNGDLKGTTRFKHWRKYSGLVKKYLEIHVKLVSELKDREPTVKAIRETRRAVGLLVRFKKLCKELIKVLVECWGEPKESARRASYTTLRRIAQSSEEMYPVVYTACYRVYMSVPITDRAKGLEIAQEDHTSDNTKLINAEETLPLFAYMRLTLAKLSSVNPAESHRLASFHIRQLAIRLRRAVVAKKKDLVKTVYNWQYLQALHLWTAVVTRVRRDGPKPSPFDDLLQPLVEIISILRRLFISPRYMPLRMHCVRMLLKFQLHNDVFIPTLAAAIELFDDLAAIDEKRPAHSKEAPKLKPIEKLISLKSAQLGDVNFRHMLATELCQLVMESAEVVRDNPAYASLLLPLDERLKVALPSSTSFASSIDAVSDLVIKKFIKSCHNPTHVQMVKELRKKLRAEQVPKEHAATRGKTRKRSRDISEVNG